MFTIDIKTMQLKTEHQEKNTREGLSNVALKPPIYSLLNLSLVHVNQGLELFKYFISLLSMYDYFSTYTN